MRYVRAGWDGSPVTVTDHAVYPIPLPRDQILWIFREEATTPTAFPPGEGAGLLTRYVCRRGTDAGLYTYLAWGETPKLAYIRGVMWLRDFYRLRPVILIGPERLDGAFWLRVTGRIARRP